MRRTLSTVVVAAALALAGCGGAADTGTEGPASTESAPQADVTGSATEPAPADGPTAEASTAGSTGSDAGAVADGSRSLQISERHPNGTVLDITGITIDGRTITLDAEFFASGQDPITITVDGATAVRLKGSDDTFYRLVPPEDAEDGVIELAPGESIGGTWSFLGPLASGTGSVAFMVNMYEASQDPNQYDRSPRPEFFIEIPLR